jgi:hypothetical protein
MNSTDLDDIACVGAFLAMAEKENMMLNGRAANEAFEAFARLVGIPAGRLRVLARDKAVDEIMKTDYDERKKAFVALAIARRDAEEAESRLRQYSAR